ncbi:unnamed protein product [Rhizophagus irregularis]|nr:unnamed protein product [Rhizophagus irregularis]
MSNKEKSHVVIATLISELESEKKAPVFGIDYITEEETKNWVSLNACKLRERIKIWGARLQKCWKELDLEAVRLLILKELEFEGNLEPKIQSFRKGNKSKNLINKEFERLEEIKEHERSEKDLEFREQEELGIVVKRRAIAVYRTKVPKSHPDNGSDIQKMLKSRRKQFREILEKEFDKYE